MRQKWTRCDFPPYAGQWWAVTLHDTVEMVDVSLKAPKHLGKAENAACDERGADAYPIDPYVYVFGSGSTGNTETIGKRRWLWWMPVVPPDRPRDDADVAGDPAPCEGTKMGKSVEHTLLEQAEAADAVQDAMDQRDASAYEPGKTSGLTGKDDASKSKMTPAGMVSAGLRIALDFIALPEKERELEMGKLGWLNPSLASLVKRALIEMAKEAGTKCQDEKNEKTG